MKLDGGSDLPLCLTPQHAIRVDDSDWDVRALAVHGLPQRGLVGFTERSAFSPFSRCSSGCCVSSVHSKINWEVLDT